MGQGGGGTPSCLSFYVTAFYKTQDFNKIREKVNRRPYYVRPGGDMPDLLHVVLAFPAGP